METHGSVVVGSGTGRVVDQVAAIFGYEHGKMNLNRSTLRETDLSREAESKRMPIETAVGRQ